MLLGARASISDFCDGFVYGLKYKSRSFFFFYSFFATIASVFVQFNFEVHWVPDWYRIVRVPFIFTFNELIIQHSPFFNTFHQPFLFLFILTTKRLF